MSYRIRPYNEERDLPRILSWWEQRIGQAPSKKILSKHGFMVQWDTDTAPCAALWLFPVKDCDWAVIWAPVTDPNSDRNKRQEALDALYDYVEQEAKRQGYSVLLSMTNIPRIQGILKERGFKEGDTAPQFLKDI